MSDTVYTVCVSFFSDNECKNLLNTTIIGNYIYPCNGNNCYDCKYIEEDFLVTFNFCHNREKWFCTKDVEKDETNEYIIMWSTFLFCFCCIFWCCCCSIY